MTHSLVLTDTINRSTVVHINIRKGKQMTNAQELKLTKRVWHGYYREAGERVTYLKNGNTIKDACGCNNFWVLDSSGQLMNVWKCEVTQ